MKNQWTLLIGLVFAIIIAIFAVVNVDQVPVNYIFGEAYWPLILVILGSALIGAVISASFVFFNLFSKTRQIKHLTKDVEQRDQQIEQLTKDVEQKSEEIQQLEKDLHAKEKQLTKQQHVQLPNVEQEIIPAEEQ
ncbi:lipopolysaccharide assembly protein LapA domain-containing protein [Metasolibacillus sp.]|uniref:LapA family protein n=1 Tax=Metasolibacillus sp. TaxID=2703680 RepID=UPI0025F709C5|nr:lipopolysaccharide assembly protein LapA domain-containing protein [Metasolibacillus sp.]MCT6923081.1 lipopolysaccharide assembly protein LapA domain-containing protein [Metasolibacillus sp.]MCT6939319.1 lipopolysaccharide assembly protein LapA domain-containing protein [Metasolibacillus sp.]